MTTFKIDLCVIFLYNNIDIKGPIHFIICEYTI